MVSELDGIIQLVTGSLVLFSSKCSGFFESRIGTH
jgi:hypothetical protein